MARRLNWEKVNRDRALKRSVADKAEFMQRDLASRWLERNGRKKKARTPFQKCRPNRQHRNTSK